MSGARDTTYLIVTGASGALGTAFVQRALETWPQVRIACLLRSEAAGDQLRQQAGAHADRLIILKADLTDAASMQAAADEFGSVGDAVGIHAAADVSWDKTADDVRGLNVDGALLFQEFMRATAARPRLIYLSTAYTRMYDWDYRNGYEETKAEAERTLRAHTGDMPFSAFACSLVVGDSRTGRIARYNGIYPVLRFLAEFTPPFLVGRKTGQHDLVPLDWVTDGLIELAGTQLRGEDARDVVASAGPGSRIGFEQMVRLCEDRINHFRAMHDMAVIAPTPILRSRQWAFLQRSLKAWEPPDIKVGDFRYFERLLKVYGIYSESDLVRDPENVARPAPAPETYMATVIDRWIDDHAERLISRKHRAGGMLEKRHERTSV